MFIQTPRLCPEEFSKTFVSVTKDEVIETQHTSNFNIKNIQFFLIPYYTLLLYFRIKDNIFTL